MNILVPIALFTWPAVVLLLMATAAEKRRAAVAAYVAAWLFLPVMRYHLPGIPDFGKAEATSLAVLAGTALFDRRALLALRPHLLDLPMALWCAAPFFSSIANDLGAYDGVSEAFAVTVAWGIPYLVGRVYLSDGRGVREVLQAIVIGGLVYAPLCLFEARMSPQLHVWVYGFHQHDWSQARREGSWRPTVFMEHGLAVGMWMATASLGAFWLWFTGARRRLAGVPMPAWVLLLAATTLACRSLGSTVLLLGGAGVLVAGRWTRRGLALLLLLLVPLAYVGARSSGAWSGQEMVSVAAAINPERAASVDYRLRAEETLIDHALQRPWFGWGGWGRNRPVTFDADVVSYAVDGLWILMLGKNGIVGLAALLGVLLLPGLLLWWKLPREAWGHPAAAAVLATGVLLALYLLDCLMNAMNNPVYMMAAGSLTGAIATSLSPAPAPPAELRVEPRAG